MESTKDFLGNTIKVGDLVVYTAPYGRSKRFLKGHIKSISDSGKKVVVTGERNWDDGKQANNVVKVVLEDDV